MRIQFLFLLLLLTSVSFLNGQDFQFDLFFEDTLGNRDTLIMGYAPGASSYIDEIYGEVDVYTPPHEFVYGMVYATPGPDMWGVLPCADGSENPFSAGWHLLEKQITGSYGCNNWPYILKIMVRNDAFPITVSWDSTLFEGSDCHPNAFISNWVELWTIAPNTCIDSVGYTLADTNSGIFTEATFEHEMANDNISYSTLILSFGDLISSIKEPIENISIYPNPAKDFLFVTPPQSAKNYKIVDLNGRTLKTGNIIGQEEMRIELNGMSSSLHYIIFQNKNAKPVGIGKILKH